MTTPRAPWSLVEVPPTCTHDPYTCTAGVACLFDACTPSEPARVVRTSTPVQGNANTHAARLLALIILYLCLLGGCGWYLTRWASYPPDQQPYTRPLRTRPPLR